MLNYWYIGANSTDVNDSPFACKILNESIVLFRDSNKTIQALTDRCSHRNVELSKGKVKDNSLMCAYHGWEFDGSGKCIYVPSLCETESGNKNINKNSDIQCYEVIEQDSYIWVWVGNRKPLENEKPFKLDNYQKKEWGYRKFETEFTNTLENVIENFIDTSHTGYIHAGLFRGSASHIAKTHIQTSEDGIIIDIEEENQSDSLLSKLLVGKNEQIHQDRFIMPSIVKVTYIFGKYRKVTAYHIFTPVDDYLTKLYLCFTFRFGVLNPVMKIVSPFFGNLILNQDRDILNNQGSVIKKYGESYVSSTADTANIWIRNYRKKIKNGESNSIKNKNITFKL